MVTIVNYKKRLSSEGKEFYSLILQGGIEMVRSAETGNFYATVKQCSIPSTMNEEGCKAVIGEKLPGQIHKVICDPYEYTIQDTGEVIELSHRWQYIDELKDFVKTESPKTVYTSMDELLA